jgi:hypothetical protein
MTASELISGAALLISLFSFWLSAHNYIRDRYKLRFDGFMLGTAGPHAETFQLGVTITNDGRRPISITEIYFETEGINGEFRIRRPIHGGMPDSLHPVTLTEHQTQRFVSDDMTLKEALALPRTVEMFVEDSAGRRHSIPVRNDAFDFAEETNERA